VLEEAIANISFTTIRAIAGLIQPTADTAIQVQVTVPMSNQPQQQLQQNQQHQRFSVTEDTPAWTVSVTGTTKLHTLVPPRLAWTDAPEEAIASSSDTTTRTTIALLTRTTVEDAIQMIMTTSTLPNQQHQQNQQDFNQSVLDSSVAWQGWATGVTPIHWQTPLKIAQRDVQEEAIANISSTTMVTNIALLIQPTADTAIQIKITNSMSNQPQQQQLQQNQRFSVMEDTPAWTVSATGTTSLHTQDPPRPAWKDVPEEAIANTLDTTTNKTTALPTKTEAEDAIQTITTISTLETARDNEKVSWLLHHESAKTTSK
jgi:hypothetical protein